MIRRNTCFLCGVELEAVVHAIAKQQHPEADDCEVVYTDEWGISIELPEAQEPQGLVLADRSSVEEEGIVVNHFTPVDEALGEIFDEHQLERLGGASSGRGWSSFSLFQRCPYAWRRRHIDPPVPKLFLTESPGLAIGSLVHAFLALYYTGMMNSPYRALTPEAAYKRLRARANPDFVAEAWRVFTAYAIYYKHEQIVPLAVEYDLRDPRTGESCRYDLVAFFPEDRPGLLSGTYIIEHKTASRFDWETLNGWQNDGECIGEVALWRRLGLDKRFGPLRGLIVNLLGKQKEPKLHRTMVAPSTWQVEQHLRDLRRWEGLMNLAKSMDSFPRARNGCVGRWGACEHWDHCLDADA